MNSLRVHEGADDFEVGMLVDEPGGCVDSVDITRVR